MHKHPGPDIQGSKPQLLPNRQNERIKQLSESYLQTRNEQMRNKNLLSAIAVAKSRGELIEKKLVQQQASYLLVNLRQRLLNLPTQAHRFVGLTDLNKIRSLLRELAINTLNEIKDLPNAVSDPDWAAKIDQDLAESK